MKRLESASPDEIETWSERVLGAETIADVFTASRAKKKTPSGRGRRGKA